MEYTKLLRSLVFAFTMVIMVHGFGIWDNEVDAYEEAVSIVGGVQIFEREFPCRMLGGDCVQRSDCYPEELTSIKGLCKKNRAFGVECCYRVKFPKKIQKCEEDFQGGCMSRCHDQLKRPADDCGEDEHCCVLVN